MHALNSQAGSLLVNTVHETKRPAPLRLCAIASRRNTAGQHAGQHAPHLQPALIEFNGEGRARVEVSWIAMIHFSHRSPAANAAKSAAPRLTLFEPAPVA